MESLLSILEKTTIFFQKYKVPNARLDAELMLAHVLKCNRMQLYLDFERPVLEEALEKLRPMMKRRAQREPLQYILGEVDFRGIELKVDSRALIPRPETEELVDWILEDHSSQSVNSILDLGTGTGAIPCALAAEFKAAEILAVDYSADALSLARENVESLGLNDRIQLLRSDWFSDVEGEFDVVVSNPPYLSDEEYDDTAPELLRYEPRMALTSGKSGLEAIERIISQSSDHLKTDGSLYLETGINQNEAIVEIVNRLGGLTVQFRKDLAGKDRFCRIRNSSNRN
ncbi:MAG: peptide chain release factor N(5)-glutamine methyltransferase [Opitutales bacterium]|nr:peptide chain release factor N(5)-glutamine methyltransferase [Opitutales bacterium]